MDRTYLWDAVEHGARVFAQMRVVRVDQRRGRAIGVSAVTPRGARVRLRARHGVVLAASATATPCLLWKSGIRSGPVGQNLMAHPGVAAAGRFAEPVDLWTGATQGHEVIGLRSEGLKFEALGYDRAMAATRVDGVGHRLAAGLGGLRQWAHWGVAVRARARGTVRPGLFGAPRIVYRLPEDDLRKMRRGLAVLGRMLHAAGAEEVDPHVFGWSRAVADAAEWDAFEQSAPLDPAAYTPVVTHIFGTCRMGSDPATSVVGPDFAHHEVAGLWVVDSSVFPSNTGVNPQTSIIALATLAANMA